MQHTKNDVSAIFSGNMGGAQDPWEAWGMGDYKMDIVGYTNITSNNPIWQDDCSIAGWYNPMDLCNEQHYTKTISNG